MKTSDEITLKSWQKAFVYIFIWLVVIVGLYILSDIITKSILLHIAFVMILLPLTTVCITFTYTKKCGIRPWLIIYLILSVLILHFFFGFNKLNPNFIITNAVCAFFGFGIGNVLKNEAIVAAQEDYDNEKKKIKEAEEKAYVSLVDIDPKTGKRANLRKKNLQNK